MGYKTKLCFVSYNFSIKVKLIELLLFLVMLLMIYSNHKCYVHGYYVLCLRKLGEDDNH